MSCTQCSKYEITSCENQETIYERFIFCDEALMMSRFWASRLGRVDILGGGDSLVKAHGWEGEAYVQVTRNIQFCLVTTCKTSASFDILWYYK